MNEWMNEWIDKYGKWKKKINNITTNFEFKLKSSEWFIQFSLIQSFKFSFQVFRLNLCDTTQYRFEYSVMNEYVLFLGRYYINKVWMVQN